MDLSIIMGFISGIGLWVGTRTFKENKTRGIVQLILTFISPVLTILWCSKKKDFVFGGTDWEFLIQTATVDKMIISWIILSLYIILIILTVYNIVKCRKSKNLKGNS